VPFEELNRSAETQMTNSRCAAVRCADRTWPHRQYWGLNAR